jgi:hypothetical protein
LVQEENKRTNMEQDLRMP